MVYMIVLLFSVWVLSFQYIKNKQHDEEIQSLMNQCTDLYRKIHGIKMESQVYRDMSKGCEISCSSLEKSLKELNDAVKSNKNRIDDLHRKYLDEPTDRWEGLVKAFGGKEK